MSEHRIDPDVKKLVLWRIETSVPEYFRLSIGGGVTYSKEELKQHVEREDRIGLGIVSAHLQFIKALSSGEFSRTLAEPEMRGKLRQKSLETTQPERKKLF